MPGGKGAVSKRQWRKMFALEKKGKVAPGTAERWADESRPYKSLPEKAKKKSKKVTKKKDKR